MVIAEVPKNYEVENLVELVEKQMKYSNIKTVEELKEKLGKHIDYTENKICDKYRLKTSVYAHRALGEYVPNTIDSIIKNRKSDENYRSCEDACKDLITRDDEMRIILDGEKEERSDVIVSDSAYGQPKEKFARFTSLGDKDEHKKDIDFLHGCRGKGHLVSLENCEFKMVISSTPDSDVWTLTFMYRRDDGEYVYITDGSDYMTFKGKLDCGKKIGKKSHGTIFHHVDYNISYKGADLSTYRKFIRLFSHGVVNPFISLRIDDRRRDDTTIHYNGIRSFVKENEELFDFIGHSSVDGELGKIDTFVAVPKENLKKSEKRKVHRVLSTTNKSVITAVDGQSHYKTGSSILVNRLGLDEIGDNALVIASLESKYASDMFDDNRTDFVDKSYKNKYRDMLAESIKNMEELNKINTDKVVISDNGFEDNKKRRLDDLDDNVDLKNHLESDNIHSVHKSNIENMNNMINAPIVDKLLKEHGLDDMLENPKKVLESGEVYVNRRSILNDKDPTQAGKSAVGQIFEILTYLVFVNHCEKSGYTCYHEPSLSDIPGLEPSDYSQEPDMDIVVVDTSTDKSPVYVFSLKTSLKERIKQSAFWMLRMKLPDFTSVIKNPSNILKNVKDMIMFENKSREIKYGYMSPVWSGGASSSILSNFDFGFVPKEKVSDDIECQYPMVKLKEILSDGSRI